jgi:hypothetical protein
MSGTMELSGTRRAFGVALAVMGVAAALWTQPAAAATFSTDVAILEPEHGQVYKIPPGDINVAVNAGSVHKWTITGQNFETFVEVKWQAQLYLSGAPVSPKNYQGGPQAVTLDNMGRWEFPDGSVHAMTNSATLTQGINYACRAVSKISLDNVLKHTSDTTNNFSVKF